ncbi:hypothetical protein [Brevundimonas sp.]|uniref:hypothetical protein n=1 Tax=Brevundimonas sp. TaxID=1871086 RepID=UPI0024895D6D|nr:hypothetical protein [Brevundimonas sp.]MDI1282522.1 hypothetical protein [Brevundimonas sp.]
MFLRLLKAARNTAAWLTAVRHYEAREHDKAIPPLMKVYRLRNLPAPSTDAPLRANLLLATLAYWTGQPELLRASLAAIVGQAKGVQNRNSPATLAYSLAYARLLDELAVDHDGSRYTPIVAFTPMPPVDLAGVRSDFIRIFPLEPRGDDVPSNAGFKVA